MARPNKKVIDQRIRIAQMRLTASEWETLTILASQSQLTVSDFMRGKILGAKPRCLKATPETVSLLKGLGELGHIRSDINQILKDRWAYKFVPPVRVSEVFLAIESISTAIHENLKENGDQGP